MSDDLFIVHYQDIGFCIHLDHLLFLTRFHLAKPVPLKAERKVVFYINELALNIDAKKGVSGCGADTLKYKFDIRSERKKIENA